MAYDTKCYDLAAAFLEDEPTLQTENKKSALAQTIQTAIEDWIQWERDHSGKVLMLGIDEYLPDNGQ